MAESRHQPLPGPPGMRCSFGVVRSRHNLGVTRQVGAAPGPHPARKMGDSRVHTRSRPRRPGQRKFRAAAGDRLRDSAGRLTAAGAQVRARLAHDRVRPQDRTVARRLPGRPGRPRNPVRRAERQPGLHPLPGPAHHPRHQAVLAVVPPRTCWGGHHGPGHRSSRRRAGPAAHVHRRQHRLGLLHRHLHRARRADHHPLRVQVRLRRRRQPRRGQLPRRGLLRHRPVGDAHQVRHPGRTPAGG